MKRILFFLLIVLTVSVSLGAKNNRTTHVQSVENKQNIEVVENSTLSMPIHPFLKSAKGDKWGAFWITFIIAAIGVYSIYGFGAGIIAVAITYFVTNGNKKAFRKAIWGCIAGCILGGLILFLKLSLMA